MDAGEKMSIEYIKARIEEIRRVGFVADNLAHQQKIEETYQKPIASISEDIFLEKICLAQLFRACSKNEQNPYLRHTYFLREYDLLCYVTGYMSFLNRDRGWEKAMYDLMIRLQTHIHQTLLKEIQDGMPGDTPLIRACIPMRNSVIYTHSSSSFSDSLSWDVSDISSFLSDPPSSGLLPPVSQNPPYSEPYSSESSHSLPVQGEGFWIPDDPTQLNMPAALFHSHFLSPDGGGCGVVRVPSTDMLGGTLCGTANPMAIVENANENTENKEEKKPLSADREILNVSSDDDEEEEESKEEKPVLPLRDIPRGGMGLMAYAGSSISSVSEELGKDDQQEESYLKSPQLTVEEGTLPGKPIDLSLDEEPSEKEDPITYSRSNRPKFGGLAPRKRSLEPITLSEEDENSSDDEKEEKRKQSFLRRLPDTQRASGVSQSTSVTTRARTANNKRQDTKSESSTTRNLPKPPQVERKPRMSKKEVYLKSMYPSTKKEKESLRRMLPEFYRTRYGKGSQVIECSIVNPDLLDKTKKRMANGRMHPAFHYVAHQPVDFSKLKDGYRFATIHPATYQLEPQNISLIKEAKAKHDVLKDAKAKRDAIVHDVLKDKKFEAEKQKIISQYGDNDRWIACIDYLPIENQQLIVAHLLLEQTQRQLVKKKAALDAAKFAQLLELRMARDSLSDSDFLLVKAEKEKRDAIVHDVLKDKNFKIEKQKIISLHADNDNLIANIDSLPIENQKLIVAHLLLEQTQRKLVKKKATLDAAKYAQLLELRMGRDSLPDSLLDPDLPPKKYKRNIKTLEILIKNGKEEKFKIASEQDDFTDFVSMKLSKSDDTLASIAAQFSRSSMIIQLILEYQISNPTQDKLIKALKVAIENKNNVFLETALKFIATNPGCSSNTEVINIVFNYFSTLKNNPAKIEEALEIAEAKSKETAKRSNDLFIKKVHELKEAAIASSSSSSSITTTEKTLKQEKTGLPITFSPLTIAKKTGEEKEEKEMVLQETEGKQSMEIEHKKTHKRNRIYEHKKVDKVKKAKTIPDSTPATLEKEEKITKGRDVLVVDLNVGKKQEAKAEETDNKEDKKEEKVEKKTVEDKRQKAKTEKKAEVGEVKERARASREAMKFYHRELEASREFSNLITSINENNLPGLKKVLNFQLPNTKYMGPILINVRTNWHAEGGYLQNNDVLHPRAKKLKKSLKDIRLYDSGLTPLMFAALNKKIDSGIIMELLNQSGVLVDLVATNFTEYKGLTALSIAKKIGNKNFEDAYENWKMLRTVPAEDITSLILAEERSTSSTSSSSSAINSRLGLMGSGSSSSTTTSSSSYVDSLQASRAATVVAPATLPVVALPSPSTLMDSVVLEATNREDPVPSFQATTHISIQGNSLFGTSSITGAGRRNPTVSFRASNVNDLSVQHEATVKAAKITVVMESLNNPRP